jgi:hypothetical protein
MKDLKDDMASMKQYIRRADKRRFNIRKRNRGYKFQIFMIMGCFYECLLKKNVWLNEL